VRSEYSQIAEFWRDGQGARWGPQPSATKTSANSEPFGQIANPSAREPSPRQNSDGWIAPSASIGRGHQRSRGCPRPSLTGRCSAVMGHSAHLLATKPPPVCKPHVRDRRITMIRVPVDLQVPAYLPCESRRVARQPPAAKQARRLSRKSRVSILGCHGPVGPSVAASATKPSSRFSPRQAKPKIGCSSIAFDDQRRRAPADHPRYGRSPSAASSSAVRAKPFSFGS
jgi:hypothetical protein